MSHIYMSRDRHVKEFITDTFPPQELFLSTFHKTVDRVAQSV